MKVSDLFKDRTVGNPTVDYFNRSVKNSYGIQASYNHKPTEENTLQKLMNEVEKVKVINTIGDDIEVSVSACNRVQKIETSKLSLRYEDCTEVKETTDNKYSMYIKNGYKVYDLYKYNFVANKSTVYMTIAVK